MTVTIHRDGTWSADGGQRRSYWKNSRYEYETTVGDEVVRAFWRADFAPMIACALRRAAETPEAK